MMASRFASPCRRAFAGSVCRDAIGTLVTLSDSKPGTSGEGLTWKEGLGIGSGRGAIEIAYARDHAYRRVAAYLRAWEDARPLLLRQGKRPELL